MRYNIRGMKLHFKSTRSKRNLVNKTYELHLALSTRNSHLLTLYRSRLCFLRTLTCLYVGGCVRTPLFVMHEAQSHLFLSGNMSSASYILLSNTLLPKLFACCFCAIHTNCGAGFCNVIDLRTCRNNAKLLFYF